MFFEMELALCERFPALDPFTLRRTRAAEVFRLMSRINDQNQRRLVRRKKTKTEEELGISLKPGEYITYNSDGEPVLNRPASDDWY